MTDAKAEAANTKPTAVDAAKLEEQKKAKAEAAKRWKEKKNQQAVERVESAKKMIGRLEKSGLFAKLDPEDQAFLKGLAEPKAAASNNTGLFVELFPNAKGIIAIEENKNAAKPKPEAIIEKMVMGRVGKYYEENCLLQQAFVKENKVSVEKHIAEVAKQVGGSIKVTGFIRFATGEGIEKRQDDLAAEVEKLVNNK